LGSTHDSRVIRANSPGRAFANAAKETEVETQEALHPQAPNQRVYAWLLVSQEDRLGYGINLYWLPLGAGGSFVRLNGRMYEGIMARLQHRRPLDLYHSALEVRLPDGRFIVENAWPIPDAEGELRGVAVEGPVFTRLLGRLRIFRYEIRVWHDGRIADIASAVESPRRVSHDPDQASRLLNLAPHVPQLVWGRDDLRIGDMWNSNSVISWLLAASGIPAEQIRPPQRGRAPGWQAGIEHFRRESKRHSPDEGSG
jgi:hypothetical protein